jgi:protein-disulfide isomerase
VKTSIALAAAVVTASTFSCTAEAQQPRAATATATTSAPSAGPLSQTQKNIESYIRHLYAFGPDIKVSVGAPTETPVEGILESKIDVLIGEDKQSAIFYVSKDGRYLFRGELSDLTKDPLAENIARMDLKNAPALGDSHAPVTLVEYADFECPMCRSLHDAVRGMLPKYAGKIRVVFKDFPIEQIHPWAKTAALAGRCAYDQDPKAFWKMYDLIYDNQEIISATTAWDKMTEYAEKSGLSVDAFKVCMASQEAAAAVDASRTNGQQLEVSSTPTVFVNGRRIVGGDPHLLEQYIDYELTQQKPAKPTEKK